MVCPLAAGALVGVWAQSFPDAALHAWAMLPPDIKGILPPNIVAMISPALVVLAILSQYVRQPKLKEKADEAGGAMSLEFISGLVVVLLGLIAGAFGLVMRGTSKAEAKAEQQRTEENAAATVAAAERKADVIQEASDVQQTVSHMGDDDVDRELRERFTRPGGG
jgi:hypothetical protein